MTLYVFVPSSLIARSVPGSWFLLAWVQLTTSSVVCKPLLTDDLDGPSHRQRERGAQPALSLHDGATRPRRARVHQPVAAQLRERPLPSGGLAQLPRHLVVQARRRVLAQARAPDGDHAVAHRSLVPRSDRLLTSLPRTE